MKFLKRFFAFVLITAVALFLFSAAKDRDSSPKGVSFWGGISSVVRRDKLYITNLPQEATIDKAYYDGNYYPASPLFLNYVTGKIIKSVFSLVNTELLLNDNAIHLASVFLLSSIPALFIFLITVVFIRKKGVSFLASVVLSLPLVFGTLLLPYSQYITNHIFVSLVFYLIFLLSFISPLENKSLQGLLLGFLMGVLFASDLSFFAILFPLWALFSLRILDLKKINLSALFIFGAGFIPALFLSAFLNCKAFDFPLPPQVLFSKYFHYPGSHFYGISDSLNINVYKPNVLIGVVNRLVGTHGMFLYMPMLLLFLTYRKKKEPGWIFILLLVLLSSFVYSLVSPNYGGWSFGARRLLPLIAPVYYYSVLSLIPLRVKEIKGRFKICVFFFLVILSTTFSFIGFRNTWFNKRLHLPRNFSYFPLLYNLNKDYFKGAIPYDP